jgi:hypothetical protein
MRTFCFLLVILMSGCVSAPPQGKAGWSVSLVNIYLGGSHTRVDTENVLTGTNTQNHTLPIDARFEDAVTATLPAK